MYRSKLKASISEINYENITFKWVISYLRKPISPIPDRNLKYVYGIRDISMQLGNIIYIIKGVNRTCISLFLNNYLNSYMNSQLFDIVPFRKKLAKNQQLINIKLMHIPLFFSNYEIWKNYITREDQSNLYFMHKRWKYNHGWKILTILKNNKVAYHYFELCFQI